MRVETQKILAGYLLATLLTSALTAQASELEEIIVTASKRDVLASSYDGQLALLSSEAISRQGLVAIDELDNSVAGLVFRQRGNRAYDNISMRGQSSMDFYNPKVQVYVDGFVLDPALYGLFMPDNIIRTEVLYGPQGTLYGRGAMGGIIDIVTAPPQAGAATAWVQWGNLSHSYGLRSGLALGSGWVAGVAAQKRSADGEYLAAADHSELGQRDEHNVQAELNFSQPDSPWAVRLMTQQAKVSSTEEQYVKADKLEQRIAFPVPNQYTLRTEQTTLKVSYHFDKMTLASLSSYRDRDLDRTVFGSYSPETQRTITQEFRLASSDNAYTHLSWVVGAYMESLDFHFARPAYATTSRQDIRNYALFGEASWRIWDDLTLTLGLRGDRRKVKATAKAGALQANGSDQFKQWTPKVALGYQLNEQVRLYALYSNGYKAGGFTTLATPATVNFHYDAETVDNIELGLKSSLWNDKVQLTTAVYHSKNKDVQLNIGFQPNQYLQNIGAASSTGVDIDLSAQLSEALQAKIGYAWNSNEFTRYYNPLTPQQNLKGNRLPYTPQHHLNAALIYHMPLPDGLGHLNPGIYINHMGKLYFDETETVGEDAITTFDMRILWSLSDRLQIDVYGKNLGNKTYKTYGFNGGPALGEMYQLAPGASYGVRVQLSLK